MNINEAKEVIIHILENNSHQPIMLWGPPGVGKSDLVRQVAEHFTLDLYDIRLSQMEPADLRGIPTVKDGNTVFCPPNEFPRKKGSMLFLDEVNAAPRAVSAAAMQLNLDRCLGEYKVPDGVPIIAAGNRVSDQAVANRMPAPLNNRFLHLTIDAHLGSMVSYALSKGWDMELIQFLRFRPELLHKLPKPLEDGKAFPSPRSWEAVFNSNALRANSADVRRFIVTGLVGAGAMTELEAFITSFSKLPDLDQVIMSPMTAKLPQESSQKYAVVAALSNIASTTNVSAIMQYLQRFPEREWVSMAVKNILETKDELRGSAELVGWLAANRAA